MAGNLGNAVDGRPRARRRYNKKSDRRSNAAPVITTRTDTGDSLNGSGIHTPRAVGRSAGGESLSGGGVARDCRK